MNIPTKLVLSVVLPTTVVMLYGVLATMRFGTSPTIRLATDALVLAAVVASAIVASRRIVSTRLSRLIDRVRGIDVAAEAELEEDALHAPAAPAPRGDDLSQLGAAIDRATGEWAAERDVLRRLLEAQETELCELRSSLAEAREHADESVRAKREFLSNISHEIRTPMNGIMGMSELLLDSSISGDEREYAETIRQSAEALMATMTEVLDLTRLIAGDLTIEPIPCDLASAIQEVIAGHGPRAADKKIEISLSYDPVAPRHLLLDAARVRQVVSHLLSNAIKFTDEGSVIVAVSALDVGESEARMRIAVEDTGIGISSDKLSVIFDSFTQVDSSMSRRQGGAGVGLAVCKHLADLMGGEIQVESRPGEGSTFAFIARFAINVARQTEALTFADLREVRVLVVDDNPVNRRVLEERLARWEMRADILSDPREVVDRLREATRTDDPYELCVVDYQMPHMTGEELGRAIKSDPDLADTPLILLTSLSARGDAKRMSAAGFAAYLVKPVRQRRLRETLAAVLGTVRGTGAGRFLTQHTLAEHDTATGVGRDLSRVSLTGRALVVEDNPINQKLATRLLRRLGVEADVASNGQLAIDRLAESSYDVVLMDCQMPVMDGVEATIRIREAEGEGTRVPIVAMTAHALQEERARCLGAGMDDFITKPIDVAMLREVLSRYLETSTPDEEEHAA